MIIRPVASPVPGFRAGGVILNLTHCYVKFVSRDVPIKLHAPIRNNMENGGSEHEGMLKNWPRLEKLKFFI